MVADDTLWGKTKRGSKMGFDKMWSALDKLGGPANRLSNKLGSEAFWPTTLDRESDKAARILRSFCKDGFYADEEVKPVDDGPKQKQRVLKKIPKEVVQKAVGLCIFTTMRTGLWVSGSGGSGVLVAKSEDGEWSPPSGVLLHTAGLGFLVGVDIYDCVIVINNRKALEGFTKLRLTLGGEISAVAGPAGVGGIVDTEIHARQAPLFTYMKSRGFYAGVQVDGTVIIERTDENERFYGEKLSAADITSGKVRHPPPEIKRLQETLKAAEGKEDVNESLIPDEKAPGDFEIEGNPHVFGVPDQEDPDPYGVQALQNEGLKIREAGTKAVPSDQEFMFSPSLDSPVQTTFQPAIAAARNRRDTVTSQKSPNGSVSVEKPDTQLPNGPPPALPSRDAVAKADDTADIVEEKPDAEHFDKAETVADEVATATEAPENSHKIELKDEEVPEESDLAEVSLEKTKDVQKRSEKDLKD